MKISICIPTYNAEFYAERIISAIKYQNLEIHEVIIVDSCSDDNTVKYFTEAGYRKFVVDKLKFDHGTTRNYAANLMHDADIIVFATQDALPASSSTLRELICSFDNQRVGASYGRQLPTVNSSPIAAHARIFNYPRQSALKGLEDIMRYGLKLAFISNSFAAYRRSALEAIGGFPKHCIVSEDTYVAAKMILAGWKVAYCADAKVYHSHNYNWRQEFQRYFDIGVFHAREPWVRKEFGGAEGEGMRFLKSEMKYLLHHAPYLIPSALFRTVIKYAGFRVGLFERHLPLGVKYRLSMQKAFWVQEGRGSDAARTVEAD
jgi:rhamnosyltransferase